MVQNELVKLYESKHRVKKRGENEQERHTGGTRNACGLL